MSRTRLSEASKAEITAPGGQVYKVWNYAAGGWERTSIEVIQEAAVSLTVNGEAWLTFMCTPVELEALAVGFLFNEGVIQSMGEIESIRVCPENDNVDVWLAHAAEKPAQWRRTSGCSGGMTAAAGKSEPRPALPSTNGWVMRPKQVSLLLRRLFEAQDLYQAAGGVHTSALSDGEHISLVVEDVGRHNTLDKLAGGCLLGGIEFPQRVLLTTGRISSEMLQKAGRMGAVVVVSRTSPTSLSIQYAQENGMTLIGYARGERFKVYAHPERINLSRASTETGTQQN